MANKQKLIEGTHYEIGGSTITDYDSDRITTKPWHFDAKGQVGGFENTRPYVYFGEHGPDRYGFFLVLQDDDTKVAKIHCGCRQFTYAQAMKHWAGGVTRCADPDYLEAHEFAHPHHLALVKCAREVAKINGWKF